jgi:hypothetical protein
VNVVGWRFLRRLVGALVLGACLMLAAVFVGSQIEQRVYRQRAELLHSKMQSIRIGRTSWAQALALFADWGRSRHFNPECDARACTMNVEEEEAVYRFISSENFLIKLDNYWRWRLKLSYDVGPFQRLEFALLRAYLHFGGHPAKVSVWIGMRDGVVECDDLVVQIESSGRPSLWSIQGNSDEFTLIANFEGIDRFQSSRRFSSYFVPPSHPEYMIGRPGGCMGCMKGWVRFTGNADPADVQRLTQANFSCLTQWRPCLTQADIMPNAWAQYLQEHPDERWLEKQ